MEKNPIKEFWNSNPVNSQFVEYEQDSKDFYLRYDDYRYTKENHILGELNLINWKGKKVLEIGLGHGSESAFIAKKGGLFWGLDLTPESIKRVKERFVIFNLKYEDIVEGDASTMQFKDDFFDIVLTHGVIHHSPEMDKIIKEIYRVLNVGGEAVIMVYHKNSLNYYFSIAFLRRIGLLTLMVFPFLSKIVSKLTGEDDERIKAHIESLRNEGLSYLTMKNFIHRSTDGPGNVYSSVWNENSLKKELAIFKEIKFKVHFLNERHLLGLQFMLPKSFKNYLSRKIGWHLWAFAKK